MDVAGTLFTNFMTILIALQDKSVSFHFAKNLDLDELDYFEFISVVCRHRHFFSFVQLFCGLLFKLRAEFKQDVNKHNGAGEFICAFKKYYTIKSFGKLDFLL